MYIYFFNVFQMVGNAQISSFHVFFEKRAKMQISLIFTYLYILVKRIRNYEGNNKADWLISFLDAIIQVSLSQRILIHDYIFCFILFFQISEASIIIGIWLHIHIILVKKEWRGFSISKKWAFGGFFLIHLFVMVEAFFSFIFFSLFLPKVKYNPKMLSFF